MSKRLLKKSIALLFSLMLVTGAAAYGTVTADAADIAEIPAAETESVYNMSVDSNDWGKWPAGPSVYSESAIVMDVDNGAVLYAKRPDDKHYPASITKLMTALVALENYKMDEVVKFTHDDVDFIQYGDAHIGIKPDEELTMEQCMYAMLLESANEVSHAIGSHMTGGYDAFVREMNERAGELGCTNSHWVNTHGLHDPEHYTSARDMALIASEVFKYDEFKKIETTYEYVIGPTNVTPEQRYAHMGHKMLLKSSPYYYEYFAGGKTGYTDEARNTLVTYASKDGVNLVAVLLRVHGGFTKAYADTKAILDYGFANFSKTKVTKDMISADKAADIKEIAEGSVTLPAGAAAADLVAKVDLPKVAGKRTGTVSFTYENQNVGTVSFTVTDAYYEKVLKAETTSRAGKNDDDKDKDKKSHQGLPIGVKILIGVFAALAVMFALLIAYRQIRLKRLRKMHRRQRYENSRER